MRKRERLNRNFTECVNSWRNEKFRKHTVTTIHESVKTFSNLCLKRVEKLFLSNESNLGYYATLNSDPMFLYIFSFLTRQFKGVFMLLDGPARKNTIMFCTHFTTYISPFILARLLHTTCLWSAEWDEMRWDEKTK